MSLGHEHGFVLIGLAGPMDVVNLSLSEALSLTQCLIALIFRAFGSSMQRFSGILDAMRSVMWHKDQKFVCALVLAIVSEAQAV